jgi:hypothetical protein
MSKTIVYVIKITDACSGCWYKQYVGMEVSFVCIMTEMPSQFLPNKPKTVFKVLGAGMPIRYIELYHAQILQERKPNKQELYGGKGKTNG